MRDTDGIRKRWLVNHLNRLLDHSGSSGPSTDRLPDKVSAMFHLVEPVGMSGHKEKIMQRHSRRLMDCCGLMRQSVFQGLCHEETSRKQCSEGRLSAKGNQNDRIRSEPQKTLYQIHQQVLCKTEKQMNGGNVMKSVLKRALVV